MDLFELLKSLNPSAKLPDHSVRVIGIDLGTTNSTVAEVSWEPGQKQPIVARCIEVEQPTHEGSYFHVLVPSVVALLQDQVVVGEGAKRMRARSVELGLVRNQNVFYDCKNEMGIRRTYHKAPVGYRSAAEIGGHVLKFLVDAARKRSEENVAKVVVTVPASFQAAQRRDTQRAAELAGFKLAGGDMLDEPVAAFLYYLVSSGNSSWRPGDTPQHLLVFDFGGGTCDVALFRLIGGESLQIAPLSVSRYHRLGGGDIDAAILYEVVLPQLLQQNGISPHDLGYDEKKNYVEPALISVAESLKIKLCREVTRLRELGNYDESTAEAISVALPGLHDCPLRERRLTLESPRLSAAEFHRVLEPFLDPDLTYYRETDYRLTCSIFAPIKDAICRSGITPDAVDLCLMVGGSSLIPEVVDRMRDFLPKARMLTFPDEEITQTAVALGAACHAFARVATGRGLVQAVCHDSISIRAETKLIELIPAGVSLPYPTAGFASCDRLVVPKTTLSGSVPLRIEFVAGPDERRLFCEVWEITAPVNQGDQLHLEYRLDENQVLDLRMTVAGAAWTEPFERSLENPLTHVVNPNKTRIEIDELEEDMRRGKYERCELPDKFRELAGKYRELGQREKAIAYLQQALQLLCRPDAGILNAMAILTDELGDAKRAERLYLEAAGTTNWNGPWFNLALLQLRQNRLGDAVASSEKALDRQRDMATLVLRASLAEKQGETDLRNRLLDEAMECARPVEVMDDWELSWYQRGAKMAGREMKNIEAEKERRRRARGPVPSAAEAALLPKVRQGESQS